MSNPEFIVLTPPGGQNPDVAIAACRAGELGIVDLEHVGEASVALAAVGRLRRFASTEFGVKVGPACRAWVASLLERPSVRPTWVLLAGGEHGRSEDWVIDFRRHGIRILFEATSRAEAQLAERLEVDGLVLKGHEAGGRVGTDTSFILLQRCADRTRLPIWVQGGIGLHTAAACRVAGAAGVVLDSQVLLARESSLGPTSRRRLAAFDGSQTICLGEGLGHLIRCHYVPAPSTRPGSSSGPTVIDELKRLEEQILASQDSPDARLQAWREAVSQRIGTDEDTRLWLLGQDAATARSLAERYVTVAGIIDAIRASVAKHTEAARRSRPLASGARLARRHATRYPIAQGPMTRVSDTPAFAEAVARAGALPFLALALMRGAEAEKLLAETRARLADRPWGVGILGFGQAEIRREQLEAICTHRPPFVLIAGGRPDQAQPFEQHGIATYLHVPSPQLLRHFLSQGARRFVFEGRECGGHVGPRTSFVLWDAVCEVLLQHVSEAGGDDDLQVLFAGGIHDRRSAAMVAALAGRLAELGTAVGVLMGSAYLFTKEAVQSGAIVSRFQQEALAAESTILLASGPGHAVRCLKTPYTEFYRREKDRYRAEGRSPDEVREVLERMNVGRLRIAAKGIDRNPLWPVSHGDGQGNEAVEKLISVPEDRQHEKGMYMVGQLVPLRAELTTMAELHEEVCDGSTRQLEGARVERPGTGVTPQPRIPSPESRAPHSAARTPGPILATPAKASDVAIIGMSCFFPQAGSLRSYWENILKAHDAITEVPLDHWDWRLFFEADSTAEGKINSKWGGFLDDVSFDPLRYGMPPKSLTSIEPLQLLLLEAVRHALADAGYAHRPFPRERTAVILGAGGGAAQLSMAYAFRAYLPLLFTVPGLPCSAAEVLEKCEPLLPKWTEDTFPGILLNVAAGRVANRFDFGGCCFAVDAACGSSLAALYVGTRELHSGASDLVVVMGGDTVQNPFTYTLFSTTSTFSPRGRCRPFDESADGIVISEGVGVVILKRLADAERDGDRIYAVIKGVGTSSDGKDRGLTAPRPEGQMRALRRAYAAAEVSPARVGLIEAHGTGTVVGDRSEVESAGRVFSEAGARPQGCALGSVKSLIGHTKCAAGLAGLINATLALHHKVRPPILIDRPNPKANFAQSPFFLNTRPRPWIHGNPQPRCAGVSAFGFGGTNFHAVLEEYTGDFLPGRAAALPSWPAELLVWRRPTRSELIEAVQTCRRALDRGAGPALQCLAASLWETAVPDSARPVLAVVASSREDLQQKLDDALAMLRSERTKWHDPRGIYFHEEPGRQNAKIAFLFPGQGSQYPDMLAELAMAFPEVRQAYDEAEGILDGELPRPLGSLIFPPSPFSAEEEEAAVRALMESDVAQPAVGAASLGMFRLLKNLAVEADFLAGHSYGEFVALCAAGALSVDDMIRLSHRRGRAIMAAASGAAGGMVAIEATRESCEPRLAEIEGVTVANFNAPGQVVVSGTDGGLERAMRELAARGIRCRRIDVSCPFHSPLVAAARESLAAALAECRIESPDRPVYSNTTAGTFPEQPAAIVGLLLDHLTSPVQFQAEIEAMYREGTRVFLEVGPHEVLTGLVGCILGDRPHLAVASNRRCRSDLVQLQHMLGQLLVHGVGVRLEHLFAGRDLSRASLSELIEEEVGRLEQQRPGETAEGPNAGPRRSRRTTTWLVNSTRVRPSQEAEPVVFGRPCSDESNQDRESSVESPESRVLDSRLLGTLDSGLSTFDVPAASDGEASRVMLRFQEMMLQFLQTQRSVMEAYLGLESSAESPEPRVDRPGSSVEKSPESSVQGLGPSTLDSRLSTLNSRLSTLNSRLSTPQDSQPSTLSPRLFDRQTLTEQLVAAVSKRTGYPSEMLDLDLNLEADLGIDSIKRVEILSGLVDSGGDPLNKTFEGAGVEMEKLTGLKSLRDIIDYLMESQESRAQSPESRVQGPRLSTLDSGLSIRRMLVRPVPIDPPPEVPSGENEGLGTGDSGLGTGDSGLGTGVNAQPPIPSLESRAPNPEPRIPSRFFAGTWLITDDGRGVATELLRRLRARGQTVALVSMPGKVDEGGARDREPGTRGSGLRTGVTPQARIPSPESRAPNPEPQTPSPCFTADLTDPDAVEELLGRIREQLGEISGLIHLLPLAGAGEQESGASRRESGIRSQRREARDEGPVKLAPSPLPRFLTSTLDTWALIPGSWRRRIRREVKSLFLLARGLARQPSWGQESGTSSERREARDEGPVKLAPDPLPRFPTSTADSRPLIPGQKLLLAATAMGGSFGVESRESRVESPESRVKSQESKALDTRLSTLDSFFPGQGGVAGLVKSLAHEWPEALVRVVDFELGSGVGDQDVEGHVNRHESGPLDPQPRTLNPIFVERLADYLMAELGDREGPVEVGYLGGKRIRLQCTPVPFESSVDSRLSTLDSRLSLDADSTILVTGGARGITAAVALELARRYRPKLALVGRSPLPAETESEETAGLTEPAELKAALLAQLLRTQRSGGGRQEAAVGAENPTFSPDPRTLTPGIEKSYRRLLREREIRANLARFRETGAKVHYYQADVRDCEALRAVIEDVRQRFGRCDGVIHGAGVIDDKLIGDKTPESFDYVFDTKLQSALNLSRLLPPEELKFCVFFSSVAGRFGNRGQSDYAAANEVLSKLATYLDQRWPGRVVSVAWGPWSQIGMVSELQHHLSQRGLQLIPPEIGPLRFDEELRYGRKGESEVVIAGAVGQLNRRAPLRQDTKGKMTKQKSENMNDEARMTKHE